MATPFATAPGQRDRFVFLANDFAAPWSRAGSRA